MKKASKNYQNTLFFVTILFFVLGIVHISFAVAGLLCFIIPFVQYWIYKDRIWCKYYCPRAGFFTKFLSKISLKKKMPKFLKSKGFKEGVVIYFAINIFFVTMSTIMVSLGRINPIEYVRFLIVFQIPLKLPQLLDFAISDALIHLGYRVYSMMFTSTVIGTILGILYMPRTWCVICPVQSLTGRKPATK